MTSIKPHVGNAQFRNHDQRQQGMLHEGVVEGAAAGLHGGHHLFGLGGDDFGGLVGHEAGDRQFDAGQFLALAYHHDAAADFAQDIGRLGHVGMVGADDDDVVAVMGHG